MGLVAVDNSPERGRVFCQHQRHAIWSDDIKKLTEATLKKLRVRFHQARRVILAGGWPRANHSLLNTRRGGYEAPSSQLLDELIKLKKAVGVSQ